jgi:cytoskeletal protein CcmA (bactofilin family)
MFRTGHRTDHTAWVEPAPEPVATPEPPAEVAPRAEAPVSVAPRKLPAAETTIGQGVTFDGTLRFVGTMRMSGGTFNGKITAGDRLIVGDGATLSADASCGSIEVHGEARGTLTARDSVELRAPARVTADVSAPSFAIDKGALFDGTVRMSGAKVTHASKRVATPE